MADLARWFERVATVSAVLTVGFSWPHTQIIKAADSGHRLAYLPGRTRGQESADRGYQCARSQNPLTMFTIYIMFTVS